MLYTFPPEQICQKIHPHPHKRSQIHVNLRILCHIFLSEQKLCRKIVDKGKGYHINHHKLNCLMKNADRVACKFPGIPVKQFLDAVRLQKVNIQGCQKQKHRSLNQDTTDNRHNIISYGDSVPNHADLAS